MGVRPRHLAAGFGVYLAVIGWLARQTAQATTGAWFGAEASLWAYSLNFVGALVLAVGLVAAAAAAGRGSVDLDRLRGKLAAIRSKLVALEIHARGEVKDDQVETLLASLDQDGPEALGSTVEGVLADVQELLAPLSVEGAGHPDGAPGNRRRSALGAMAGPVAVCAGLAAVSGALLPASSGFLQTNFAFNTFLVLTIAYGWMGLLVYALGSAIVVLLSR